MFADPAVDRQKVLTNHGMKPYIDSAGPFLWRFEIDPDGHKGEALSSPQTLSE